MFMLRKSMGYGATGLCLLLSLACPGPWPFNNHSSDPNPPYSPPPITLSGPSNMVNGGAGAAVQVYGSYFSTVRWELAGPGRISDGPESSNTAASTTAYYRPPADYDALKTEAQIQAFLKDPSGVEQKSTVLVVKLSEQKDPMRFFLAPPTLPEMSVRLGDRIYLSTQASPTPAGFQVQWTLETPPSVSDAGLLAGTPGYNLYSYAAGAYYQAPTSALSAFDVVVNAETNDPWKHEARKAKVLIHVLRP